MGTSSPASASASGDTGEYCAGLRVSPLPRRSQRPAPTVADWQDSCTTIRRMPTLQACAVKSRTGTVQACVPGPIVSADDAVAEYIGDANVRARVVEFCGATRGGRPTAAYLAPLGPTPRNGDAPDLARSLW